MTFGAALLSSQRFFSGASMGSPLSKTRSGECLAITIQIHREANLTVASTRHCFPAKRFVGRHVIRPAIPYSGKGGRAPHAGAIVNDLEKRFPENTSVRFSYLPTLRGLLAIMRREPTKAVDQLEAAVRNELGTPRSTIHGYFGALYPVYVRDEAYLAGGQGQEAAAEFQKILDHRGIVVGDPIGALAHLQLGRAYALAGDKTKAVSAYEDFLSLWKDADPDLPIYKATKAEYAKLQ